MKIQCLARREGGTVADIGGIAYHFEPLPDGAHVAEVAHEDHIDRFLAIPEGYKVYHGAETPKGKPAVLATSRPAPVDPVTPKPTGRLAGSAQHQPYYEIGGAKVALVDVVRQAFAASNLDEDGWNELDEDDRGARIDIMLDTLADAAEAAPVPAPELDRATLAKAYEAKFGKAPHYRASAATIKAQLDA